jgi:enamine deaminase RidA (YjgF/YER057c/UK114 family)
MHCLSGERGLVHLYISTCARLHLTHSKTNLIFNLPVYFTTPAIPSHSHTLPPSSPSSHLHLHLHNKSPVPSTMSHLQYHAYPGFGQFILQNFGHQQAVRVGDRIECAGQGGWDPQTGEINTEIKAQIERAFENVELCLRVSILVSFLPFPVHQLWEGERMG